MRSQLEVQSFYYEKYRNRLCSEFCFICYMRKNLPFEIYSPTIFVKGRGCKMLRNKEQLREDLLNIAMYAVDCAKPNAAVARAMDSLCFGDGEVYLVAVGKAAWEMADAAVRHLKHPIRKGIVLTKYGHIYGNIPGVICLEAGHPVPDENCMRGTQEILTMTTDLKPSDTVLFLLSGGGSSLFELPLISLEDLETITERMLRAGMSIVEINTIRKRLSAVKGGRFAEWCMPAKVETVILSDVLGDAVDMIASGPTVADTSTCTQALELAERYDLFISPEVSSCLRKETPKEVTNVRCHMIGSVKQLCDAAVERAAELGYETHFLTDGLCCEASCAGKELAMLLKQNACKGKKLAFIAGGETVVHVTGNGLGGRNQELALAAAVELNGVPDAALLSIGSDGTDGPTDAAGGCVDGGTLCKIEKKGLSAVAMLKNNDAYHALDAAGALIKTGPTGTNVNDLIVGLILE